MSNPFLSQSPVTVDNVADFIIMKCTAGFTSLSALKLQKLVYYAQAWRLAFTGQRLFNGEFQAWVHGPVNRELFDRFKDAKSLYSEITAADISAGFNPEALPPDVVAHLNSVLEAYAGLSGSQLEDMTHSEAPWLEARRGFAPAERCTTLISDATMTSYYRMRASS